MKKSMILAIVLLALSIGVFPYATGWVSEGKEAITVKETVLYGDRRAAEGVAVLNRTHCDYHMFWNTTYRVGSKLSVESNYRYSQAQLREDDGRASDLQLYTNINYAMSGDIDFSGENWNDLPRLVAADVAKRTPNGETHEEEISLADYYRFYPVTLELYLSKGQTTVYSARHDMADYFKIPVPQNHKVRVAITKGKNGAVNYIEQSSTEGDFQLSSGSTAISESGGYFAVSVSGQNNGQITMPEGISGIHFLPFTKAEGGIEPDWEGLRRDYPLKETEQVLHLIKDPKEERLLLFTRENEAVMLSVIDMETMELIRKSKLEEAVEDLSLWDVKIYDSFLVVTLSDYRFLLLQRDSDGLFVLKFAGNFNQNDKIGEKLQFDTAAMDFDGSHLAVAGYQPYTSYREGGGQYQYFASHSTYLMIYDEKGLTFAGKYDQSSDALPVPTDRADSTRKSVRAIDKNPLSVSFE
ncbi:hypothetical protein FRZ06_13580 [Anoxybacterium hadale]|uniref:Uncharacterized protein n=1 Tax=Anoxybacterium hadale TaxID=3408580 RepID=A0ACD1ACV3_9FIRM|nr:hypothetical protein FRZ06_13580 [Clostridiales bacterium]